MAAPKLVWSVGLSLGRSGGCSGGLVSNGAMRLGGSQLNAHALARPSRIWRSD